MTDPPRFNVLEHAVVATSANNIHGARQQPGLEPADRLLECVFFLFRVAAKYSTT